MAKRIVWLTRDTTESAPCSLFQSEPEWRGRTFRDKKGRKRLDFSAALAEQLFGAVLEPGQRQRLQVSALGSPVTEEITE